MEENVALRKALREDMAAQRGNLTASQVEELSAKITAKLSDLEPIRKARTIMGFASFRNEVDLIPFLEEQKRQGKTILLPRVKDKNTMEAVEFTSWEDINQGSFGIREPDGEPFDVESIDVVLVPGLVFDYRGYRLGYGRGYYDNFLVNLKKGAFICGICYEFQVVENVTPHAADIPVHWIVTEKSELCIDWDYF
ncbi:MAG: 5-formyltetrahydrofolate cyclo-ligase [Syntrophomonadaceae bacterium]|nr:5-formyltetrahydrofolate cyclo-ligase [Syntrophomonadaceae bacterium]